MERRFTMADQERFAAVSGDRNPLHMDPVAARRLIAGAPVVHGVHTCLWALDAVLARNPGFAGGTLEATFVQAVYLNDRVTLDVQDHGTAIRVRGEVLGALVLDLRLDAGPPASPAIETPHIEGPLLRPTVPRAPSRAEMASAAGRVPLDPAAAAALFPAAAEALGAARVAGLLAASFVVGMVCPGLHSVFAGLKLAATSEPGGTAAFRVRSVDARFGLMRLDFAGGGWRGTLSCYASPGPVAQPGMAAIAAHVAPDAFAGAVVLVVGGSRGLGELIAKLAAAGGAAVMLSWATGSEDARRVQAEIVAHGGKCEIVRYDVREALPDLPLRPTAVYYMATPAIAATSRAGFQAARLDRFLDVYVHGFHRLATTLRQRYGDGIALFYPSSTHVATPPATLAEYAMAKAAGEVLCATMLPTERPGRIIVRRLPPLATDQTATVLPGAAPDGIGLLLACMRDVQA